MPRPVLDEAQIHPAVRGRIATLHDATLAQVRDAVARHPVVVVGMAFNPFVRKARRALDAAGIAHHDIDFGGYLSQWRRRNALKMWTGWPTYPMVFVRGMLVGGAEDLDRLIAGGELARLLDSGGPTANAAGATGGAKAAPEAAARGRGAPG